MITDRRIVITKSGKLAVLAKGLAAGGAVGLATGALGAVGAAAMMSLGSVAKTARVPSLDDDRRTAIEEVDAYAAAKPDNFQAFFEQASAVQMKKGGLFGESKIIIQSPAGPLEVQIGAWYKELFVVMQQVLGQKLMAV